MRAPLLHPSSQKHNNWILLVRFAACTLILVGAIAIFQRQNVALNEKAVAVTTHNFHEQDPVGVATHDMWTNDASQHKLDSDSEESVGGELDKMDEIFEANKMTPPSDPEKYNVKDLVSRSKSDLSLRASIVEPKDWDPVKDKPTLCNSAFNNKKVSEDICKVEDGVAKVKYPHWGGDLIPVADPKKTAGREFLITTILGKFQEAAPPAGCTTGTVWFLGCDQGNGKKCEGKDGIKRGDVEIETFKGAIAVLDVAQDTYVSMIMANLQRRIRLCKKEQKLIHDNEVATWKGVAEKNGQLEALDAGTFKWDDFYKNKAEEAKAAVKAACTTIDEKAKNYILYSGIHTGQLTFWAVFNVPFLFQSLGRGDVIRFTNDPKTRRSGTFARELELLWSEKEPSFGYEGKKGDMGALKACGYKPSFYAKDKDVQPVAKMSTPGKGYAASEFQRDQSFTDKSKCLEIEKEARDIAENACKKVNALMTEEWEKFHIASRSSTSED